MIRIFRKFSNYLCTDIFTWPFDVLVIKITGYVLYRVYDLLTRSSNELLPSEHVVLPPMDIRVVTTHTEWDSVHLELLEQCESIPVLGLDAEWINRFGRRHPVSLLQLAGKNGLCVLIRLNLLPKPFPATLKSLLSDSSILKVGVGINMDVGNLRIDHDLHIRGYLDLRNVLQRIPGEYTCRSYSLKNLAKAIINVDMDKNKSITLSDWETDELSKQQLHYAALDALVGVTIFLQLIFTNMHKQRQRMLMSVFGRSRDIRQPTDEDIKKGIRSLLAGIVDSNTPEYTARKKLLKMKESTSAEKKDSLRAHSLRSYNLRRNPLYDNCQLLAPDNQLLCTCDARKAKWYLSKGLGEMVVENPLVVRLKFEPSGRPENEENYYVQEKENICVVCGKPENYLRKNIIPHEYRKYFPSVMKDHVSHDILLMCPPCHQRASLSDVGFRQQLAQECNASLESAVINKSVIDVDLAKIRSAAKALLQSSHKIPEDRMRELQEFLKKSLGLETLSIDDLQRSANMNVKIINPDYSPHGFQVVEYMKKHRKLLEFQLRWREHFLETMKPQFLPSKWSVTHNHEALAKLLEQDYIASYNVLLVPPPPPPPPTPPPIPRKFSYN